MSFISYQFLFFFPLVVILYFSLPFRFRWLMLLLTSYYFYMCWRPEYVLLIIASTLVDYVAALKMEQCPDKRAKRPYLWLSLLLNLGLLFFFKYFNFFNDSLRYLFQQYNAFYDVPAFKVLLPVGISFYTFQTLSYSIDVYRGERKAERHLGIFALYVAFFPQLVAGPIERSSHLMPQFWKNNNFDYQRVTDGLKLAAWGFFKKLVIADRLAILVNQIYNNPTDYTGLPFVVATICFAYQIYCDFSGYSDIAIGTAQVLGYDIMQNFRQPYFSRSVQEFWRRWHISLSTWFRDYVYVAMGGNRVKPFQWFFNIIFVFVISGLWHGANWTFVIWGALHGAYYLLSIWTKHIRLACVHVFQLHRHFLVHHGIQIMTTFLLVCFAWIFFRANSLHDAVYIVWQIFTNFEGQIRGIDYGLRPHQLAIAVGAILILESVHLWQHKGSVRAMIAQQPAWLRWGLYYGMIGVIIVCGIYKGSSFIYFQF